MPQPDKEEIEEVCWFHRDWIREALKGPEAADSFYFGGDGRPHHRARTTPPLHRSAVWFAGVLPPELSTAESIDSCFVHCRPEQATSTLACRGRTPLPA